MDKTTAVIVSLIVATLVYLLTGNPLLFFISFIWLVFYFWYLPGKIFTLIGFIWLLINTLLKLNNLLYPALLIFLGIALSLMKRKHETTDFRKLKIISLMPVFQIVIVILFMLAGYFSYTFYEKQKNQVTAETEKTVEKVIITVN